LIVRAAPWKSCPRVNRSACRGNADATAACEQEAPLVAALERLCREALSAEEMATPWLDQRTFHGRQAERESDWIWVCLTALWQRWFPDQPCFEFLDDKIEAGYDLQGPGGAQAACRIWLQAWRDVLGLLDKGGLPSIHAFDERFRGSQSRFNWIQDLEDALWNAGLEDRQFLTARIAVCEEGLRRFPAEDELMTENRRRALAESYFELGETAKAEALYRDWLCPWAPFARWPTLSL